MNMDILAYVLIGLIAAAIVGVVVFLVVKLAKMSKEDRKAYLVTYLKGIVALAEKEIGAGHGADKLAMVEDYFNKKAPVFVKIVLTVFGAQNLRELIEIALKEIKESFEKENENK